MTTNITLPRATVQQALEALETKGEHHPRVYAAITALLTALEKQQAEPVQRKELTDKELNLIGAQWHYNLLGKDDKADLFAFVRASIAASGIKEQP